MSESNVGRQLSNLCLHPSSIDNISFPLSSNGANDSLLPPLIIRTVLRFCIYYRINFAGKTALK